MSYWNAVFGWSRSCLTLRPWLQPVLIASVRPSRVGWTWRGTALNVLSITIMNAHINHWPFFLSLSVTSLPSWYQNLPLVSETFQLTRTMIEVLNTDSSSHCPKKSWTWNTVQLFKRQRAVSTQGICAHSPHFYMVFTYQISEQILFDFSFYIYTDMEKSVDSLLKFKIKYTLLLSFIMSLKFNSILSIFRVGKKLQKL